MGPDAPPTSARRAGPRRPRPLTGRGRAAGSAALAGLALAWLALAPRPAAAALRGPAGGEGEARLPRNTVDLSVGPYRPVLSGDPRIVAARHKVFDDGHNWLGTHPVQFGVLYGRYLLREVGLLGPYLRAGYWRQSNPSRLCFAGGDQDTPVTCTLETLAGSKTGNDTAALNVVPVGVGAVWRLDQLRRNLDWPLSFAVRAGVDYHFWWATVGDAIEQLHDDGNKKARGGSWGVSGALQVALALDGLRRHHPSYGSRRAGPPTYLYGEYRLVWAPGLLQGGRRLDLSDLGGFAIGLALELP